MAKKKTKSEWEYYEPTKEDYEAMRFCIRNNIRISMKPMQQGMHPSSFKITVNLGSYEKFEKTNLSPSIYDKEIIVQEMYKAMKYYYDKHSKRV
jgi:hypothetical protein